MTRLSRDEVQSRLEKVKGWKLHGKEIKKSYSFEDFSESISFVNKIAHLAEKANHHPDILIQYDTVTLTLSTHDEGGLTRRDFNLASQIDALRHAKSET